MKEIIIISLVVLLLMLANASKKASMKTKKTKQYMPHIDCDIKAGKIMDVEFLAKCPAGCQESKYRVYGSDIYASFSSVCSAAIHSGVIDNSGGKILVKKISGQSGYTGSFSNGIRSLSLPRWKESFIITGKGKKSPSYPSVLEYASPNITTAKTGDRKQKVYQTSTMSTTPEPPATVASESFTTKDPHPTTTSTLISTKSTTATINKPLPPILRPRDIGHVQSATGRGHNQVFRSASTSASNRDFARIKTGISRQDPISTLLRPSGLPFGPGHKRFQQTISEKGIQPGQVNPNCKIDLAFLIDGSWSIGKRRFRIQKLFLSEMAQTLQVGSVGPLMGIVQYGDDPSTEFGLKTYSKSKDVQAAIERIQQKGGLSNVGQALSYVNKNFFSDANGNRGGAPNVALVLVDGWPTDKVEVASRLARESGINIFFVTIEGADEHEKPHVVEPNFVDKAVCRTNGFFSMNVPSWFSLRKIVQPLVKRVCDTDRLMCSKTCLNAADIGFIIDGSSSVGTGNFRTVLQFIVNITKEFEISDTDTRIGAVQYTYEQRLEFGFDKHSTKEDVVNAIKRINYWSGGTSTGAAISYASAHLFSKSKPNKRKIMIVITDGRSYDDVRVPATTAHRNGVIAYAIGIAWAAHDELQSIATDPDKEHFFFVDEFDSLYKYVGKIIQNICTEFNSQPRN
ncbi:vitrin isoform X2 [Pleurodeles waltl]|uniref:vitrin isoform X2 n=1 Tax=Pleurodeles waltl TaxID=8319 RepID=UPI00370977FB